MSPESSRMLPAERRATLGLASIFVLRMLGLFLLLPVLSLYVDELPGATPLLVGLALGIYGLTQATLQIPFGMLSDRIGRKPVIIAGLVLFALGSIVAAQADSIWGIVLGRAMQGSGAIAAAVMALAADLTREGQRLKVMASIGISISLAFGIALVMGPLLDHLMGLSGIFWTTAVLAVVALLILHFGVQTPLSSHVHYDAEPVRSQFGRVLRIGDLLRLDFGIAALHFSLMATFMAVPRLITDMGGLARDQHWWIYAPVVLLSTAAIIPFVIIAERRRCMKQVLIVAVGGLMIAELCLAFVSPNIWAIGAALLLYFASFNLLEGLLPSLIAKLAPAGAKGTAMGFYSTSQFLGAFLGGVGGGAMLGAYGISGSFLLAAAVALIWLGVALGMRPPPHLGSLVVAVPDHDETALADFARRLSGIEGVVDAVVIPQERMAYLKVESERLDHVALERLKLERGGIDA